MKNAFFNKNIGIMAMSAAVLYGLMSISKSIKENTEQRKQECACDKEIVDKMDEYLYGDYDNDETVDDEFYYDDKPLNYNKVYKFQNMEKVMEIVKSGECDISGYYEIRGIGYLELNDGEDGRNIEKAGGVQINGEEKEVFYDVIGNVSTMLFCFDNVDSFMEFYNHIKGKLDKSKIKRLHGKYYVDLSEIGIDEQEKYENIAIECMGEEISDIKEAAYILMKF